MFGHSATNIAATEVEPEVLVFIVALIKAIKPAYIIETGTYQGTTSKAIGEALIFQGGGKLDTVDICEQCVQIAKVKVIGLPVTVYQMSSLDFIPSQPVDLAFLDSDVGNVRFRELKRFSKYMARQGIVLLHDTASLWQEVDDWNWVKLQTKLGLTLLQYKGTS